MDFEMSDRALSASEMTCKNELSGVEDDVDAWLILQAVLLVSEAGRPSGACRMVTSAAPELAPLSACATIRDDECSDGRALDGLGAAVRGAGRLAPLG